MKKQGSDFVADEEAIKLLQSFDKVVGIFGDSYGLRRYMEEDDRSPRRRWSSVGFSMTDGKTHFDVWSPHGGDKSLALVEAKSQVVDFGLLADFLKTVVSPAKLSKP